jgi:hypothetical protein
VSIIQSSQNNKEFNKRGEKKINAKSKLQVQEEMKVDFSECNREGERMYYREKEKRGQVCN